MTVPHLRCDCVLAAMILTVVPMTGVRADPPGPDGSDSAQKPHPARQATRTSAGRNTAQRQREVSELLEQLNAETRRQRVTAARKLIELGPEMLPLLPSPDSLPNASVREVVAQIRRHLEHVQAQQSVQASRVTLQETLWLETLVREVSKRTGNGLEFAVIPDELRQKPFAVNYRNEPFWGVLDDLADRAGLQFDMDPDSAQLRLATGPPPDEADHELAVAHSGAFRIAVRSARLRPLLGDAAHQLLRLRCTLLAEPRLRPLFLQYSGTDMAAKADNEDLQPFTPRARYELPLGERGAELTFNVDFRVPLDQKLPEVNVSGTVNLKTAAGEERFDFEDLPSRRQESRRHGGVSVTLQGAEFETVRQPESDTGSAGGTHSVQVRLAVDYDAGGPVFESHRTWVFHNRVYLESENGRRIEPSTPFTTLLQADGSIAVEYRFEHLKKNLDRYRLVYFAPTLLIDVPVEFELEKIPVTPRERRRR